MKQMKILGVLALALTLGLAACGGAAGGEEGGDAAKSSCKTHKWGDPVVTVQPTCTGKGKQVRTCTVCGEKKESDVPAAGHKYVEVAGTRVEAQVGQAGSYKEKCSVCGDEQTRTIAALVPSATITKASLRSADEKVYLDLEGTQQYFTAANFKWAFGLKKQGQDSYLIGKAAESLEEADYNIVGTIKDDNSFVVSYPLTDIPQPQGFNAKKNGLYNIYAGPYNGVDNSGYTTLGLSVDPSSEQVFGTNTADAGFNYYFRNDQETSSVLTLGIMGNIAPFHCETAIATFVEGVGNKTEGVKYTQDEIDAAKAEDPEFNKTTDDWKVEPVKNPDETFAEIGGKWRDESMTLAEVEAELAETYKADVEAKEAQPAVEGVKYTQDEIDAAKAEDPTFDKTVDDWKVEPKEAVPAVEGYTAPVFIQFQSESGSSYYGPRNHSGRSANNQNDSITWSFRAEEKDGKVYAYIKINVSFMGSIGEGAYNTHMNLSENSQENCVMEGDFENEAVALPGGTQELVIFSHPAGGNTASNAYGNLAFKVQAKTAA